MVFEKKTDKMATRKRHAAAFKAMVAPKGEQTFAELAAQIWWGRNGPDWVIIVHCVDSRFVFP